MRICVLVATMNQTDYSLLKKIGIKSEAVVVNQCEKDSVENIDYAGNKITWVNTTQRGLSKSRNMALSYVKEADICLIADEDEVLSENYVSIVSTAFENNKKADIISFNFSKSNIDRERLATYRNNTNKKSKWFHYYSSVSLAFRYDKILKNGIHFNELIGAGTKYTSGEEAVFLSECRKKGLKVFEREDVICDVDFSNSIWFSGYDEKFFHDKGVFLAIAYGWSAKIFALYFVFRLHGHTELKSKKMLSAINAGIKEWREM